MKQEGTIANDVANSRGDLVAPGQTRNVFITGGAGFVGSTFIERLVKLPDIGKITVFDRNAQNPERSRIKATDTRIRLVAGDLQDLAFVTREAAGHDTIIHLASNADIARAEKEPTIDFHQGTVLTQNILEAARINGVKCILYASGSGVYGECAEALKEDTRRFQPISTYGASKLAGEALLSAYCHMFEMRGTVLRFANIVGARQTHGVAFDFVKKLQANPGELHILGDGKQTKSYISVDDACDAAWLAHERGDKSFDVFNVAGNDTISVNEIAQLAIEETVGKGAEVALKFTGSDRGWRGDIPVVRLNTDKIRALGFTPKLSSREAIRVAIIGIIEATR